MIASKGDDLKPVADEGLERLAAALTAKGVRVARHARLDEKTLARAKPARLAVLGRLERVKNTIQIELRLMEVSTGNELRSYSNTSTDPKAIVAVGTRAAERIALSVEEHRSGRAP